MHQKGTQQPDRSGAITLPPFIYGGAFLIGLFIHFALPAPLMRQPFAVMLGVLLIAISIPIIVFSMRELARSHTAIDVRKPTTFLVTSGPYRFSRNPIYVAMTLLYCGAALLVNSTAILIMLLPALMVMQSGVVLREEKYLEWKFGHVYRRYKNIVRRWI